MKYRNFKLLFFGSDTFSVRILKHLLYQKICPLCVVTKSNTLLNKFAVKHKITSYKWPIDSLNLDDEKQINIGLVASFGQMIDVKTICKFKYGLFNVHPSLLPEYRGSTPIQTAILKGAPDTGCTIMRIPPIAKFDVGDIIIQERVQIKYREYALDLSDRLADLGASMAVRLLLNYDECMRHSRPQNEGTTSYARKIKLQEGEVRFKSETTEVIDRKVRAYTGYIDLYTSCLSGLRIKLHDVRDPKEVECYDIERLYRYRNKNIIDNSDNLEPGSMYFHKTRYMLCIKCADGKWIAFDHITPDAKRKMTAVEFYNGYLSHKLPEEMMTDL